MRDIDAAVREKGGWILAKLDEQQRRSLQSAAERIVWADGATLQFLGAPVRVTLGARPGLAAGEVRLEDLPAAADGEAGAAAPPRTSAWRTASRPSGCATSSRAGCSARRAACSRRAAAHFAERLGVRVTRLSLSSAKTRWGSANASGAIRLHWRLIQYPLATIDYVVAHELAHLREMNHGPRFWAVVGSVVPDYRAARRQLGSEPLAAWD